MTVVTRFAPSPTGDLHLGSARTALFNYLYARHHGGKYRLRIEDTDHARNTPEAVRAIYDGLAWLGIEHDGDVVLQSQRADRHREVVQAMLANGTAYKCFMTDEQVAEAKAKNRETGKAFRSNYRDNIPQNELQNSMARSLIKFDIHAVFDSPFVVRLRAPTDGETVIEDQVQGRVAVQNSTLDDMILLRSDGTPTYMLAVVVDDHDMGATHVIRGDDHLNNAFRQLPIYDALGWSRPTYAHIPLIHDDTGKKFSKRSGAAAVSDYADMGILPEAMLNYLVKLGWGHGDDEIISHDQMIEWFDLPAVNRAASRFDQKKLMSLNEHYLRSMDEEDLTWAIITGLTSTQPFDNDTSMVLDDPDPNVVAMLKAAISSLKPRCSTIPQMVEMARFYVERPTVRVDHDFNGVLAAFPESWERSHIEQSFRDLCANTGQKLKDVVVPVRLAITGSTVSPPIFEAMEILGRDEVMVRLIGSR